MKKKSNILRSWILENLITSSLQPVKKAPLVLWMEEPSSISRLGPQFNEINWSVKPREISCITTWINRYKHSLFTSTVAEIYQLNNGNEILYSLADITSRGWQIKDLNQHFLLLEGDLPEGFSVVPTSEKVLSDRDLNIFIVKIKQLVENNCPSGIIEQIVKNTTQKIKGIEKKSQLIAKVNEEIVNTKAMKLKKAYCNYCNYFAGIGINNRQYVYCAVHPNGSSLNNNSPTCLDYTEN